MFIHRYLYTHFYFIKLSKDASLKHEQDVKKKECLDIKNKLKKIICRTGKINVKN